jgi:hypothetical protein
MWIPFRSLEHAFDDPLTPEDCRRYVGYVRTTRGAQLTLVPVIAATILAAGGFVLLMLCRRYGWFPVPFMHSAWAGVCWACMAVGAFALVWLLLRDFLLWWGVRAEFHRARCPKCRHSLQGLRVEEIGTGLDPTKRFVRCVECGRKYRLMDLGLTPMDLVPFEQRGVPQDFGKVRL